MKKPDKKPRYEAVIMEFTEPVKINSISFDGSGNFKMFSDGIEMKPKTMHFERGIEREKKNKIILSCQIDGMNTNMYSELHNYNYLVALDTNYDKNSCTAVGTVYEIMISSDDSSFEMIHLTDLKREFNNVMDNNVSPELIALNSLISFFSEGNIINDFTNSRIMVVVDHNLGKLESYNSRNCPLIEGDENTYLPENIRIVYASADKYNDSLFNQLIKACDEEATFLRIKKD